MDIRHVRPEEAEQAVKLTNLVFQRQEPGKKSYAESHPLVFSPGLEQSFGVYEEGKLVSFIGLVPSVVKIGPAAVSCYSIGGVCTHPDFRGRGYAEHALRAVMEHVEQAGASLLLVSGDRGLYSRVHCCPFGSVSRFTLMAGAVEPGGSAGGAEAGLAIREMRDTDWLRLRAAAAGRLCAFEQSVWDLALLLRAEAMGTVSKQAYKVLVAERNDELCGYAVIGIPHPGTGSEAAAIEWAGDGGTVAALLRDAVVRYGLAKLSVPVPWHEKELMQELSPAKAASETNGGTVKVISPERLLRQLRPYLRDKAGDAAGRLRFEAAGEGRVLVALEDRSAVLEPAAFVSLLFDPEPAIAFDDRELGLAWGKLFPIPFPYTYGLNYI